MITFRLFAMCVAFFVTLNSNAQFAQGIVKQAAKSAIKNSVKKEAKAAVKQEIKIATKNSIKKELNDVAKKEAAAIVRAEVRTASKKTTKELAEKATGTTFKKGAKKEVKTVLDKTASQSIKTAEKDVAKTTLSKEATSSLTYTPVEKVATQNKNVSFKDLAEQRAAGIKQKVGNASEIKIQGNKKIQTNTKPIKTINDGLVGQKHPDTGVPYVKKVVETDTGEKVEGVFPQFESKFSIQLHEGLQKAPDRTQFAECNKKLKESLEKNPKLKKNFTKDQLADIEEGYTPEGYTWHHNEERGKMQLVETETHSKTRHTGGRNIWGGGTENRH